MPARSDTSSFLRGFRDGLPFLLVIVPFALLFGVVGTEAGLSIAQVMGFSVLVVAGASQFTAVQLLSENAPTVIVLATALVVNLRMAMYSAALAPHLGAAPLWQRALIAYFNVDQTYALGQAKFEADPAQPLARKVAYFFGTAAPVCPLWFAFTYVGAVAGAAIPPEFALDFAVPITFLALVAPALKSLAHVAAALVSVALALLLAGLPSGLGLILAAAAAMTVGAQVELWQEKARDMTAGTAEIWTVILVLGLGTFLIRFSFLGLIGRRKLPPVVLRHLRYTAVAVLPGLVAPLALWPQATGGEPDAARLAAAAATFAVGLITRSTLAAILGGAAALYGGLYFLG